MNRVRSYSVLCLSQTPLMWLLLIAFFFSFMNLGFSQKPIKTGEKHIIQSRELGEERELWIGLPEFYDSTKVYPTIYILDAEWQFDITYSISKELAANDKIPAHIVIGIPKIDSDHRFKNLTFSSTRVNSAGESDPSIAAYFNSENTSGGTDFLNFLRNEAIPYVETNYSTNDFDVFIGHSLSGYFGAYILSEETTFNAYQFYDASIWYNNGDVNHRLDSILTGNFASNVFITSAAGGKDKQEFHLEMHQVLKDILQNRQVNVTLKTYENEDHGSVRLPSLIDGLTQLYEGYSIGYILPEDKISVESAEEHYRKFSQKVHFEFSCPVDTYRWIGFANHSQGEWKKAIDAYEKCITIYSEDANVQRELAECYYSEKEFSKSLIHYKLALNLDPKNKLYTSKINEIELLQNN